MRGAPYFGPQRNYINENDFVSQVYVGIKVSGEFVKRTLNCSLLPTGYGLLIKHKLDAIHSHGETCFILIINILLKSSS